MVFVDRPPLSATATSPASTLANAAYNKLLPRALGPFRVISVQPHPLTIDEEGIPNTIFIDRATRVPTEPQAVAQNLTLTVEHHQGRHSSPEPTTHRPHSSPDHLAHRQHPLPATEHNRTTRRGDKLKRTNGNAEERARHASATTTTASEHTTPGGAVTREHANRYTADGTDQAYTVDRIVRNLGTGNNIRYVVRW